LLLHGAALSGRHRGGHALVSAHQAQEVHIIPGVLLLGDDQHVSSLDGEDLAINMLIWNGHHDLVAPPDGEPQSGKLDSLTVEGDFVDVQVHAISRVEDLVEADGSSTHVVHDFEVVGVLEPHGPRESYFIGHGIATERPRRVWHHVHPIGSREGQAVLCKVVHVRDVREGEALFIGVGVLHL